MPNMEINFDEAKTKFYHSSVLIPPLFLPEWNMLTCYRYSSGFNKLALICLCVFNRLNKTIDAQISKDIQLLLIKYIARDWLSFQKNLFFKILKKMKGSKPPENYNDFLTRFGYKNTDYKIVSLTASVIKEQIRFNYFKDMIQSVRNQNLYPDLFFLSIHISPKLNISNEDFNNIFKDFPCKYYILKQKRPKKQFLQYKEMFNRLDQHFDDLNKTWIMFSDDDDLWNTMRTKVFFAGINLFKVSYPNSDEEKFVCVGIPESVKQKVDAKVCCKIHTSFDVTKGISCGCVEVEIQSLEQIQRNIITKKGIWAEHHEYLIKTQVLGNFLKQNNFLVETNRYCDMDFRYFIISYKHNLNYKSVFIPIEEWMYFYRASCGEYSQVSTELRYNDKVKDTQDFLLQTVEMTMTKTMNHRVNDRLQEYSTHMKFNNKQKKEFINKYEYMLNEQIKQKKEFKNNNKKQKI